MKKIIVFTISILLFSVVAVKAQTYLQPLPGGTYTYTATVTDPGNNNPVRWYVTTDATGLTRAISPDDFTFVTGGYDAADRQLEGTAVYSVQITWGTGITDGSNFYIFLEVDDDVSGCTNRMALHVQTAADFNAVVADVSGSATPGTVDPLTIDGTTCPDDPQNPIFGSYDAGYTELVFRVNKQFSLLAWQFGYAVTEGTSKAFTIENLRVVDEGGTVLYTGTSATGTINTLDAGDDYALVYIQITNQPGVELDINLDLVTTGSATRDAGGNADSNAADNNADHTIQPMPVISGFTGG